MAKLMSQCCMLGVASNVYKGVTYSSANLLFDEDGSVLTVGIDREQPALLSELSKHKRLDGMATLLIRDIKGTKYMDLVAFVPKKA